MALLNSQNFYAQRKQFHKVNAGYAHHQPNISTVEWLILCSISRCGRSRNIFFSSSCWNLHSKQSFFSIFLRFTELCANEFIFFGDFVDLYFMFVDATGICSVVRHSIDVIINIWMMPQFVKQSKHCYFLIKMIENEKLSLRRHNSCVFWLITSCWC